nr:hypothetical protein [Neosynechococcus sphagnicola]
MLLSASSEFVALCRLQVVLLSQALGASQSIVYLTEDLNLGADAKLVPVVAYPEVSVQREDIQTWVSLPSEADQGISSCLLAAPALPLPLTDQMPPGRPNRSLVTQQQLMLPLMHESVMLGLLVTAREDRVWTTWEQTQIEKTCPHPGNRLRFRSAIPLVTPRSAAAAVPRTAAARYSRQPAASTPESAHSPPNLWETAAQAPLTQRSQSRNCHQYCPRKRSVTRSIETG